jgi:hypothetical protein
MNEITLFDGIKAFGSNPEGKFIDNFCMLLLISKIDIVKRYQWTCGGMSL